MYGRRHYAIRVKVADLGTFYLGSTGKVDSLVYLGTEVVLFKTKAVAVAKLAALQARPDQWAQRFRQAEVVVI